MKSVFTFCLLLLCCLLSACGFHLRGKADLSPQLAAVAIDSRLIDTILSDNILRVLAEMGYAPVAKESAKVVITLLSEDSGKRVLSIGALGKEQEFEISYRVNYTLTYQQEASQTKITPVKQVLILKRDMSYDVTAALGKSKEEQIIYQELQQEAATRIIRHIQYLKQPPEQSTGSTQAVPDSAPVETPAGEQQPNQAQEPAQADEQTVEQTTEAPLNGPSSAVGQNPSTEIPETIDSPPVTPESAPLPESNP